MGYERRGPNRHLPLKELATRQHGVVTTAQLEALGYSRSSTAKAARVGRLHRLYRGVYSVGHADLSWNGRCLAAVFACAPAVASHWTAAWLWGLMRSRPTVFHLSASKTRHKRSTIVVHSANLTTDDTAVVDQVPVTALARTVLDLAALEPGRTPRDLKTADDANRLDLREFEALLSRSVGHHGYSALARAVDLYRPDPTVTRSGVERRFRALLRRSGLPAPAMNLVVAGYELDAYWPDHRLAVELDTYGTHGSRLSFEEDRKRGRVLGLLGITLERVTDRQLDTEADEVLRAVAARLGGATYSAPA